MILLFGGLGNVGLNLARYIQSMNIDVTVLGRQKPTIVKELFPDIHYIYCDLTSDEKWLFRDNNKYEIAVNLAYSSAHFANKVIKDNKIMMNNIYKNRDNFEKIIHISTTAVQGYGTDPPNKLKSNYCWDDFYTLAKSVQEAEIIKNNYPFHVIRIANYLGEDSIFLKALAILTQLSVDPNDFNFVSDITTTEDIYGTLTDPNIRLLTNLYPETNYSWQELISACKSEWSDFYDTGYLFDYSKYENSKDYKYIARFLTKIVPMRFQKKLEIALKNNPYTINLFQQEVSNLDYISSIYKVRRKGSHLIPNRISRFFTFDPLTTYEFEESLTHNDNKSLSQMIFPYADNIGRYRLSD